MVKKIDSDNRVLALTKRIGLRMALFLPFQGGLRGIFKDYAP